MGVLSIDIQPRKIVKRTKDGTCGISIPREIADMLRINKGDLCQIRCYSDRIELIIPPDKCKCDAGAAIRKINSFGKTKRTETLGVIIPKSEVIRHGYKFGDLFEPVLEIVNERGAKIVYRKIT